MSKSNESLIEKLQEYAFISQETGKVCVTMERVEEIIRQHEADRKCEHCGVGGYYTCDCLKTSEICDDNYMTVVFDRSVVNFNKNPMHIKSEFGNVVAISRGDALAEISPYLRTTEPVDIEIKNDRVCIAGKWFYAQPEPVAVDLGKCANAAHDVLYGTTNPNVQADGGWIMIAKAVLDAAGVPYHD